MFGDGNLYGGNGVTPEQITDIDSQLGDITNNGSIKGFKDLTQAEYDALTLEEKNDGTVYLIVEE